LKRLRKRGCESEAVIQKRFKQAEREIKEISWYDYIIVNQDLQKAIQQLKAIYIAEKCRRKRLNQEIKKISNKFL